MSETYCTAIESQTKVRIFHSDDILSALVLAGFTLHLAEDPRGRLWVSGLPLKLFVKAARFELARRGVHVSILNLRTVLLALNFIRKGEK